MEETSLSKTVAVLSSEMFDIKRLLQSLQLVGSAIHAAITEVDQGSASSRIGDESPNSPVL